MITQEILAITYGLSSAVSWGAGDFSGGIASRKSGALAVVLFSQLIGAFFLFLLAFLFSETFPPLRYMLRGGLAGIFGVLGLVALYVGLSRGRMGIVAPLSAVITALIPIAFAFYKEGVPDTAKMAGLSLALISVWLLSYNRGNARLSANEFYLPLLAGIGFGLFFVFIDSAIDQSVLWPLVGTRCASVGVMFMLYTTSASAKRPTIGQFPLIALAGILDILGNLFFALATHIGRLDISATLSSLYPAATVMLAWLILKEKLFRRQWAGVLIALIALALIAA